MIKWTVYLFFKLIKLEVMMLRRIRSTRYAESGDEEMACFELIIRYLYRSLSTEH